MYVYIGRGDGHRHPRIISTPELRNLDFVDLLPNKICDWDTFISVIGWLVSILSIARSLWFGELIKLTKKK